MRLADVDFAAIAGDSALHRAGAGAKLLAAALLLAGVVLSTNVLLVVALGLGLLATAAMLRLPVGPLLSAAAYPAFFAVVFALAAAGDVLFGALIVAKAVTAALLVVLLARTTPYPQLLAPVQRVLPSLLSDALLFTYRSFFLLAEKLADLVRAIRLRSGLRLSSPGSAVRVASRSLGGLLLFGMDLAQRDADVLRLRGYERRLRVAPRATRSPVLDAAIVLGAALALAAASVWRIAYEALNPYSWVPVAVAACVLAVAALARLLSRDRSETP